MNYLTATELAEAFNITINYNPAFTNKTFEEFTYGKIARATSLDIEFLETMTDLELAYFLDGSSQNFVDLQKETVLAYVELKTETELA